MSLKVKCKLPEGLAGRKKSSTFSIFDALFSSEKRGVRPNNWSVSYKFDTIIRCFSYMCSESERTCFSWSNHKILFYRLKTPENLVFLTLYLKSKNGGVQPKIIKCFWIIPCFLNLNYTLFNFIFSVSECTRVTKSCHQRGFFEVKKPWHLALSRLFFLTKKRRIAAKKCKCFRQILNVHTFISYMFSGDRFYSK